MDRKTMLVVVIFAVLGLSSADGSKRKIESILYPNCKNYKSCIQGRDQNASDPGANFPNLAYVRAADDSDILHFVMTTVNLPSILVVHTTGSKNSRLHVDWDHLLGVNKTDMAGAINVTGGGDFQYGFALVFSRLIEYDDINDDASLPSAEANPKTRWNITDFTQFQWNNLTLAKGERSVLFNTTDPQPAPYGNNSRGIISLEFEINSDSGRDTDLPRLIFNSNNTQFNFALDKYVPLYNKSRFALELTVVAKQTKKSMKIEEERSIDDEFSPGVFKVVNWFTGGKGDDTAGYVQWKPVCYLDPKRGRAVGTKVVHSHLLEPNKVKGLDGLLEQSLARAFFGNDSSATSKMSSNMSFGLSDDGFYLKNNYTVWTGSVGYGTAPVESISTTVLIIIAAGLGIPAVLIIFGGIYVCIKKRRTGYMRIGDDGLTSSYPNLNG